MNTTPTLLALILLFAPALGQDEPKAPPKPGRITGRISPEAHITILAKIEGTDASRPENVKARVTLEKGGAFSLEGLLPGTYDLLFDLHGESEKNYVALRWSEIAVKEGETTSG